MLKDDEQDAHQAFESVYPENMRVRHADGKYIVGAMQMLWDVFARGWTARDKQLASKVIAAGQGHINSMGYTYEGPELKSNTTYELKIEGISNADRNNG